MPTCAVVARESALDAGKRGAGRGTAVAWNVGIMASTVLRTSVHVLASVTLAVLAACGGAASSAGVDECGSSASCAAPDGGLSGDSGNDGGAPACTTASVIGRRACVPGTAKAGAPLELAIDASDGCLGCFTTLACKVSVAGTTITLEMQATTCPPAGDVACPAVCLVPQTTCSIPALAEGTYDVKVVGDGERPGLAPRKLVVAASASATTCTLPQPGTPPTTLDTSTYATSCSEDTDCILATGGDLCTPCKCPTTAIAKTDAEKYAADARAV